MRVKDEQKFAEYKKLNSADPYSARCVSYAEDVADLLEADMLSHPDKTPDEVIGLLADQRCTDADVDGITGFMYGAACWTLKHHWVFGEEFGRWREAQKAATGL